MNLFVLVEIVFGLKQLQQAVGLKATGRGVVGITVPLIVNVPTRHQPVLAATVMDIKLERMEQTLFFVISAAKKANLLNHY